MVKPDIGPLLGVILAGGLSRRMGGGDKCLSPLAARPILAHVIERAAPQTSELILNCNSDAANFSSFGLKTVPDIITGFKGPLAGVHAGMIWAGQNMPGCRYIVTVAADTPFFPLDLVTKLSQSLELQNPTIILAQSPGKDGIYRTHPVFGLWPLAFSDELLMALNTGTRKVGTWAIKMGAKLCSFNLLPIGAYNIDPFFNINSPEDVHKAEHLINLGASEY